MSVSTYMQADYKVNLQAEAFKLLIVFLTEEEDPVISQVNRRIQLITGLSDETVEFLQVADYSIGGFFEPHLDYFLGFDSEPLEPDETGNRVATFMTYMSDVEAGGASVFPHLGSIIAPKKGTAMFWYNLLQSGKGDHLFPVGGSMSENKSS
ncbi:prolyl 4-hydroxylase subunit alpha-2-like [Leptonychotes weddellii]|uniref:Prolyl 4-hydroxylase subunit alpha-2-like n=1 Tax=Leptonychotes weddellii TaxID=9713 RepID=A0A7F8RQI4_LEPWE|nr:prolyl 4-hydroxylase subunit alpha-2-like [Leptonychotes weddellii]